MVKRSKNRRSLNRSSATDSIILRGRNSVLTVTGNAGGTAVALTTLTLSLNNFGDRPVAVGAAFLRWRIKSLQFSYRSNLGSAATSSGIGTANDVGLLTMGVADDADNTSTAITTRDQILNFRKAVEKQIWKDLNLSWSPIDKSKWYYITSESSSSDARFVTPGTLAFIGTNCNFAASQAIGFIDVRYVLEFSGASTIAV